MKRTRKQWGERERRYMYTLTVHQGKTANEAVEAMMERFGRAPAVRHLRTVVAKMCKEHGQRYPFEKLKTWRIEKVLEMANTGSFRTVAELHAQVVQVMRNPPHADTIGDWLRDAGIRLEKRKSYKAGYRREAREMAVKLYKQGHTAKDVATITAGMIGRVPSLTWVYDCLREAGVPLTRFGTGRRVAPVPVIPEPQADRRRPYLMREWEANEKRTQRMVSKSPRLWWSRETSENPRWNPDAGKSGRLAA